MINIFKKLLLIYDIKPFNERGNTFFINYKNDIYVFFRNFLFLGNLSSLDFFYLYIDFIKKKYISGIISYQFLYLFKDLFKNLNFDRVFCIKKKVKFK
ncbi:hypothetical protein CA212_117 [Candidatus Nasuia deltocephalinicola]|nr:hypothetical protein CA212_117 [Candidatus Nasuia deltocephalinicola]